MAWHTPISDLIIKSVLNYMKGQIKGRQSKSIRNVAAFSRKNVLGEHILCIRSAVVLPLTVLLNLKCKISHCLFTLVSFKKRVKYRFGFMCDRKGIYFETWQSFCVHIMEVKGGRYGSVTNVLQKYHLWCRLQVMRFWNNVIVSKWWQN